LRGNCPLKHVIEGRIEVTGRRGKRCKQLLYDGKEEEWVLGIGSESPKCLLVENSFGRRYGLLVRQTTERMNE
jgi:hypothetical protein